VHIEELKTFYILDSLANHNDMRSTLLSYFEQVDSDSNKLHSEDAIQRLDWSRAKDFTRPWAKYFTKSINDKLMEVITELGYNEYVIDELWFQQYIQGGYHGWHAHGSSFTAVYYLELDEGAPKTELIEPYMQGRKITADVKEGDLLLFPSFVLHRAPKVISDTRKTIVSFNVNFYSPDHATLLKASKL
jgi:hypothetical protein